jgi:amino acid adenylation domain-containing protein/non-ribosomal peptide synthase protein (TIGR01720 family)
MGDEQAFPVSFAQQRLWVLDRLSPGTPQYNLANAVQFSEPIDPRVLSWAVREIVGRHESLRTTFRAVDGQPVQVVGPAADIVLAVVDLGGLVEPSQVIHDEIRRPFDLTRGPLLRIALLRQSEREQVLVVTMHHIVSDGWSIGVFFRELTALYQAFARGEPSPLPDLPIQYVDYALWQRDWLADGRLARQMEYWRRQLAGLPLLELPADHPRPAEATFRGARRPFAVPAPVAERLRALCRQEDATLFMVLLGAFQTLLHRYSGQDDVVVGMPVAGRDRPELADLIGFFVNTLVLRLDLGGNPTFREVLRRVKTMALEAYEHQDVPFEKLVEELKPERDPSRNPFFQVTFQLLQLPSGGGALSTRSLDVDGGTAGFDLSFDLWEEPSGLGGRIEHSTDLFAPATVERMATHFGALLDRVSADPDLRLGEIGLATADELRMLLEWNDTAWGAAPFVHQLFARQAAFAPEAVALVDGADCLTYHELEERARQVARRLRAAGVGPEALVALDLPRSAELVAAMLGVLAAGGAYLPLDTTWPRERTAAMLVDAKPRVVFSALAHEETVEEPEASLSPENLAYVIYTSGSTGRPNGCLISHGALANHCAAIISHYGLQATDRVLQFASPAFDVAAEEIFPTLASGATLCLPPADLSFPRFMGFLAEVGVTVANLPAGFWHAWVSYLAETGASLPGSLRLVVVGSAPVATRQMALWRGLAPHVRVCNAYGVSEAAITTTIYDVPPDVLPRPASVSIGRPIANTQVYVLDAYRQPVPPGLPGELYLGGAGLARGYLDRPELTAERFVLHSFDGISAVRLYRTGDRARHLPDGTVECLGRLDEQISLRGFRIEPEEVEAALAAHPAVARAAVVAAGDGEKQLVAHVVPRERGQISSRELRAFAGERLPRYMVPSVFVVTAELPLTPGGKLDRRALRAAGIPRQPGGDSTAPTTPAEELLAAIWKEILGLDRVGIHDNFFELGGDSILSIRIMSRANQAGLRLNPMQIFQHQTIAELAAVAGSRPVPEPEWTVGDGPFHLTPIQQWFFDQDLPAPHHYNQSVLLDLPEDVDPAALERALGALIDHHDALRLRFERADGGWHQRYRPAGGPVPLESHAAELQASLDLADGPLLRAALEPETQRLLLAIHHLATDGLSWRILLEDLWTSYRQDAAGEPVRLPEKTASFQQWAVRLRELARSGALRAQLDAWLSQPYERLCDLPVDFPEGENTVGSESTVSIALSPDETQALLRDAPRTYRTEINDLLLTALALALSEWSGAPAHLVDVEGHGREPLFADVDVSRTVGWFTSIRPVLLDPGPSLEPGAALKRIKEQLRAVPHHGIGHGLLRYLSGDEAVMRSLASLPKAQISFNYMGQFEAAGSVERMDCGPTRDPRQPRGYLLELNGHVADGRLRFDWSFSRDVHTAATITKVARRFRSGLEALVQGSGSVEGSVFIPSDFPLANFNQDQLDKLMRKMQR